MVRCRRPLPKDASFYPTRRKLDELLDEDFRLSRRLQEAQGRSAGACATSSRRTSNASSVRRTSCAASRRPITKGGKVELRAMTDQAVMYTLQRRARDGGVKPFTPHDLRRACASELWDAGVDGATIQRMLGHENITTTSRYDRRGARGARAAAEALHFRF